MKATKTPAQRGRGFGVPARTLTSLGRAASGPQLQSERLPPPRGRSLRIADRAAQAAAFASTCVPACARDHGHRLMGPGGGRAGSGSRVGELVSAVKGSGGQFWPGIRSWKKSLSGLVRAGMGCLWGWSLDPELALFPHPPASPKLRKHR